MKEYIEVMVWISNPDDFLNWHPERKLERYERVVAWHEYIIDLASKGKVTHAWGSHELLSRSEFASSLGLLIAVYRVKSWSEFDFLINSDPLRDISQYVTTPLTEILDDREDDQRRYDQHKTSFLGHADPIRTRVYEECRARFDLPPDYVGKYPYVNPVNAPTSFTDTLSPGDPMQILILGTNPAEYITMWEDVRQLVHHEKVLWWFDYVAMLVTQGKVSHGWGTHDFCVITGEKTNSCGAVTVYSVQRYSEFDELYSLDPLRRSSLFWSVLLQPIADQRQLDIRRLDTAKENARKFAILCP